MIFGCLGRELQKRGHRFTLFGVPDLAGAAAEQGISFYPLDNSRNLLPAVNSYYHTVEENQGVSLREMFRCGMGEIALYCEQVPKAMQEAGVSCVIGDQTVVCARTIAERLDIPFITLGTSTPLIANSGIPPAQTLWPYSSTWRARSRNSLAYGFFALLSTPFARKVNTYRRAWGLRPYRTLNESISTLAQITQLVPEFDFPVRGGRAGLHYVGPYDRNSSQKIEFPYERLDGRRMILAAIGMQLGANPKIWRIISESCMGLNVQLVISLGGRGRADDYADLPGEPLVVSFAPQRELLKHATLMINHGGINSVMEALAEAVPLVILPACSDQPGIAARVMACGAGEFIAMKQCRSDNLRPAIERVLSDPRYRTGAALMQDAIKKTGGIEEAADVIEQAVKFGEAGRRLSNPLSSAPFSGPQL